MSAGNWASGKLRQNRHRPPAAHFLICFLFFYFFLFCAMMKGQDRVVDSLLSMISYQGEDTSKVNLLHRLCLAYQRSGKFEMALESEQQTLQLAQKLKWKKGEAKALNSIGIILKNLGKFTEAIGIHSQALSIRKETGDKSGMSDSYNNMAVLFQLMGNYPEALRNNFVSLKLREETGDKKGIADSYNNIGLIYENQGDFSNALKYHFHSLAIRKEINDRMGIGSCYNNIGLVSLKQNKIEDAFQNFSEALNIFRETGNKYHLGATYNNLGLVYEKKCSQPGLSDAEKLKIIRAGIENELAGLAVEKESGNKLEEANSLLNLATFYLKLQDFGKALKILNEGLALAKEYRNREQLAACFNGLSNINLATGNYKKAFEYYKKYILYRDSLVNEVNTKKSVQALMHYEFEKKSSADSIRNAEAKYLEEARHQQEISTQRQYTYAGIAGFLVMIAVAGISYNAFRNKKRANIEIARQKVLVEEKQKEILDSIHYARRIQKALITSEKYIERNLDKHFSRK